MIIVQLKGGLGNQMFQFAAGYSFAKRIQLEMSIDMSFLNKNIYETENFTPRKFELDSFQNLPKCKIIEENLVNYFEINESNVHSNFPLRKLFKQKFLLNDYFQGERYFSNINNEVNKLFEFNKLLLDENTRALEKEILLSQNSVAIHVRRGDYLKPKVNQFHGTCEIDYYKKAVELIIDKTISPKFYFFSDDVNWVKSELASYDQVMDAFSKGAEWCGYGWSAGGMALFPTQESTWSLLQQEQDPIKRTGCGRPGVNGGYFDPSLKFGVNCFGIKPASKGSQLPLPLPGTDPKAFDQMVDKFKKMMNSISLSPFNRNVWSESSELKLLNKPKLSDLGKLEKDITKVL